jgi:hypothetical protein
MRANLLVGLYVILDSDQTVCHNSHTVSMYVSADIANLVNFEP